jgi:hypothetical protein
MKKMDTKELETLRKNREDAYDEVYKLVTLVTCGYEGRDTITDAVKKHGDANKALAAYEATHKGVVKYAEAEKQRERNKQPFNMLKPYYASMLDNMWGITPALKGKKAKGKKVKPLKKGDKIKVTFKGPVASFKSKA